MRCFDLEGLRRSQTHSVLVPPFHLRSANPLQEVSLCALRLAYVPHNGGSSFRGLVEQGVPEREELVAPPDGISHESHHVWLKQPWLTPPCVQVGVCSKEWVEGPALVPAYQELYIRVLEETTNISCREDRECVRACVRVRVCVCVCV